jgi:hypothetical protein
MCERACVCVCTSGTYFKTKRMFEMLVWAFICNESNVGRYSQQAVNEVEAKPSATSGRRGWGGRERARERCFDNQEVPKGW